MKEMKEIKDVNIFEIKAEKHILCGPPAIWELEATVTVYFKDGSSIVQYIQTCDLEEAGWQVSTKSMKEILDNDEEISPYLVRSWSEEEKQEALKSPYGKAIRKLDSIFKKIAVL